MASDPEAGDSNISPCSNFVLIADISQTGPQSDTSSNGKLGNKQILRELESLTIPSTLANCVHAVNVSATNNTKK